MMNNKFLKCFSILFLFSLLGVTLAAWAQATIPQLPNVEVAPTGAELEAFMGSVGKASGPMAIGMLVAQFLMLALRWSGFLQEKTGRYKWTVAAGLHVVMCVLTLRMAGLGWAETATHAGMSAALGNFLHQFVKQVSESQAAPVAPKV